MCITGSGERVVHCPRREEQEDKLQMPPLLMGICSLGHNAAAASLDGTRLVLSSGQVLLVLSLLLSLHIPYRFLLVI